MVIGGGTLLSAAVVCAVCGVAGGWCMGRDGKTISTLAPYLSSTEWAESPRGRSRLDRILSTRMASVFPYINEACIASTVHSPPQPTTSG